MTSPTNDPSHTPGPWSDHAPEIDGVVAENYRYIESAEYPNGHEIGDTANWGYTSFCISGYISPANARLIAAAPDLLAALRECVLAYDFAARGHDGIARRAQAALAKAEGK